MQTIIKPILTILFAVTVTVSCKTQQRSDGLKDIKKSTCKFDDEVYNVDSIVSQQQVELTDSNVRAFFSDLVKGKSDLLERSKTNDSLLFPYTTVDSAVYIGYHAPPDKSTDFRLAVRKPAYATILCDRKIKAMINLVNNPNHFGYGECGTPIPQSQLLFYKKGEKVAEIVFSCGRGQLLCKPGYNMLSNFGGLNELGIKRLEEIAPWK